MAATGDSEKEQGAREASGLGIPGEEEARSPVLGALSQRDSGVQLIHIKPHFVPGAVGTVVTFGIWLTEHRRLWERAGGRGHCSRLVVALMPHDKKPLSRASP